MLRRHPLKSPLRRTCPQPICLSIRLILKTNSYRIFFALVVAVAASHTFAQAPARGDKIMSINELRSCMMLERANTIAAAEILQTQQAFKSDQDSVKAEQAEVDRINQATRERIAAITAERAALSAAISAHGTKAQAASTDAEKAAADAERVTLVQRGDALQQSVDTLNAAQPPLRERIAALNVRIEAINQRNKTVNDRVEPHKQRAAEWRDQCASRRFREEDEVMIKKEMAATK